MITDTLRKIRNRRKKRTERFRGIVESFDMNQETGVIRMADTLYSISRKDIAQEARLLPENETVTFEIEHNEAGLQLVKVRTLYTRKRGKVFYINDQSGKIRSNDGQVYFFSFDDIHHQFRKMRMNELVEFNCSKKEDGNVATKIICDNNYSLLKFCRNAFAFIYPLLAAKTAPENWNYINLEHESELPLLRNYFLHTFEHAMEQDLIAYHYQKEFKLAHAYFNTGLLTAEGNEIYAVFNKKNADENYKHPAGWTWKKFTDDDTFLMITADRAPLSPRYYYHPDEVTFKEDAPFFILNRRIAANCGALMPPAFLSGDFDFLSACIKKSIDESLQLFKKQSLKPVAKVYNNKIEFVLPFYHNNKITLAMTVKWSNNNYVVNNLLPLENAYKCARLLGPVTEKWLQPVCFFEKADWV